MREGARFSLDTIAFLVVVGLLAIGAAWVLVRSGETQAPTASAALAAAIASPPASPSVTALSKTVPVVKGELRLSAPKTDTWVEVRKNGPEGAVLLSGMVRRGTTRVFVAEVLWLRLRNPSHVGLRVEGHKIPPNGSADPVEYIVKNGKLERQG